MWLQGTGVMGIVRADCRVIGWSKRKKLGRAEEMVLGNAILEGRF